MNELNGYICLHRKLRQWGWYKDLVVKAVFIELLLTANWKPSYYQGHLIERGQTVTGIKALSSTLGITEKQARRALNKLEKTGEICRQRASKFSIVTLCNFNDYQPSTNEEGQSQVMSQGISQGKSQGTTLISKEDNKVINNNIYITEIVNYLNETTGKSFRATQKVKGLLADLIDNGYSVDDAKRVIDKKSKDWLGTVYEPGLSPKSLFDADKFDSYLNESKAVKKADVKQLKNELAWLQITWNEEGLSAEQEQRMHELEELLNDIA